MVAKVTMDKAGRVILPKQLRVELQLSPGDTLEAETTGEEITLRPVRGAAALRKKHGIWVYRAGEPLSEAFTQKALREVRRERDEANLGRGR